MPHPCKGSPKKKNQIQKKVISVITSTLEKVSCPPLLPNVVHSSQKTLQFSPHGVCLRLFTSLYISNNRTFRRFQLRRLSLGAALGEEPRNRILLRDVGVRGGLLLQDESRCVLLSSPIKSFARQTLTLIVGRGVGGFVV